ncbi:hypothetical protein [Allorhizocola rhizosphaerae]|nr:hypothetical protein [Allorhizocola rhizosphaerae]
MRRIGTSQIAVTIDGWRTTATLGAGCIRVAPARSGTPVDSGRVQIAAA